MFQRTTAIKKMMAMKARKRVIQGGTSSGKTYGIIPILIDWAIKNERKRITVVAESIPAVKDGAVKIFQDIMVETNRWIDNHWIGNPMEYTFSSGTVIQFKSFDTVGKAKASGKRDMLFLNEGNHIPFEIADALMIRSKQTWIDFNPDAEFWAHTEILQEHNSEFLLLTYEDNEGIPPETLEDLHIKIGKAFHDPNGSWTDPDNVKNAYWRNWVTVYIEGEIGNLQGVIYNNWKQCDNIPPGAELIAYGLDWGFTNDPTAMSAIYRYNGKLYIDQLIYLTGLTNSMIIAEMVRQGVRKDIAIVADSAEPKSIQDLSNAGFYIEPAKKGADSIRAGVDILQEYEIFVTSNSLETIKELRNYKWAVDRAGKTLNVPCDGFNHALDEWRYVALNKLALHQGSGNYSFA
jgi:phage terminase large subunit